VETRRIRSGPLPSRCVTYRIVERADSRVDLKIKSVTGFTVQREGFASLTEADAALRDLRTAFSAHK
jgi:hypothetical protein